MSDSYSTEKHMIQMECQLNVDIAKKNSQYLDCAQITQMEKDATEDINGQANMKQKLLDQHYSTQMDMVRTECQLNITMAVNHFQQQREVADAAGYSSSRNDH